MEKYYKWHRWFTQKYGFVPTRLWVEEDVYRDMYQHAFNSWRDDMTYTAMTFGKWTPPPTELTFAGIPTEVR